LSGGLVQDLRIQIRYTTSLASAAVAGRSAGGETAGKASSAGLAKEIALPQLDTASALSAIFLHDVHRMRPVAYFFCFSDCKDQLLPKKA
jgi:hypothetical protein